MSETSNRAGESPQKQLPLDEVEKIVDLVKRSDVGEIQVRRGELEITVKARAEPLLSAAPAISHHKAVPEPASEAAQEFSPKRNGLCEVRSPVVGTFYRSPAPGEEPYVEVGDRVKAGQTLCIIEAMKMMNEIPADVSGEVVEVLAENAEGVEYDQPLFYLRPEE